MRERAMMDQMMAGGKMWGHGPDRRLCEGPKWVDSSGLIAAVRTAGIGALQPMANGAAYG